MKKYVIYILIAIVIIASVVVAIIIKNNNSTTKEVSTQKVRLNEVTRSVFYAPQYVAIAKGYMEEEGIEVDITTGQGADAVMTAVLAGQSDIGFARARSGNICVQ